MATADNNVVPIGEGRKLGCATRNGKRYSYPKSLLWQDYFCRIPKTGEHLLPHLSLGMLVNSEFKSPLWALLQELKADGHDVQGAIIEYRAFVEGAKAYEQERFNYMRSLTSSEPLPLVKHLLLAPDHI